MSLMNKGRFDKDHPCWIKDKSTPIYKSIRKNFKYKQWRQSVFERDGFKCVFCGVGGNLEVDHIKRFIDIIRENNIQTFNEALECEELYEMSNGRTLCIKCHRQTDTWGKQKG